MSNQYCPFNQSQLSLMIEVQMGEDWRADCFVEVLKENVEAAETNISQEDFTNLVESLSKYEIQAIADLQLVLNILGNLPDTIYYTGNFPYSIF